MTLWLAGVGGLLILALMLFGFGVTSEYRGVHRRAQDRRAAP